MTTKLTEQQLLTGAWYSLEQAGILLTSAVSLYDARQWSTSIGVAMLGCEELGRFEILRALAKSTTTKAVTVADVRSKCASHEGKQAEGIRYHVLRPRNDSTLGKALAARTQHGFSSPVGNLKVAGWAPDIEKAKKAMADPPKLPSPRWPGWVPNP